MDLKTAQTDTTAKLPLLKQGKYDMWKLRDEPILSTTRLCSMGYPVTADEKTQKKNDVKTRSFRRLQQNQDNSRRTINVEEISSKAMLAIDGAGFDWSFMADEEVPTDMALMEFSDSERNSNSPSLKIMDQSSKSDSEDTSKEINFVKPQQQEKPVKYAEMYRRTGYFEIVDASWPHDKETNVPNLSRLQEFELRISFLLEEPKEEELLVKELLKLVLLKVPRKNNMYSVDMKNIVPKESLTCLMAKATLDESMLWHGGLVICDNGTKFKNKEMNQFCEMKRIKREFSVARTPKQNGVAERKNRTLIEAVKTMLADSKLLTTFWAEAVNTACHVQNRVLVIKPHNKTPYELFHGRTPSLSFMRPFGCPVIILNTLDHLGKFDGKADKGFFVGYSVNSKAFKVFNSRTRIVEETLHITFLENKPNVAGSGPEWLFDIDTLIKSMNYKPVVAGNQSNGNAGTKACDDAGKARVETISGKDYILIPLWTQDPQFSSSLKDSPDAGFKPSGDEEKKDTEDS
ncbi:ribonuclease H-like domain-containing protein [Tanacetum coccineum]